MSASLKGKLIAGFVLAFLAGGATGSFFAFRHAHDWQTRFGHHSLAEHMRERLTSELKLTPEQMAKVQPILDDATKKLQQIRSDTGNRVRQVMQQMHDSLQPILTAEQRARLQSMEERMHQHHRGSPNGPHRRGGRRAPEQANDQDNQ
jgi:gas vesicle protein